MDSFVKDLVGMKDAVMKFDETICLKASKSQLLEMQEKFEHYYVKASLFPDQQMEIDKMLRDLEADRQRVKSDYEYF